MTGAQRNQEDGALDGKEHLHVWKKHMRHEFLCNSMSLKV